MKRLGWFGFFGLAVLITVLMVPDLYAQANGPLRMLSNYVLINLGPEPPEETTGDTNLPYTGRKAKIGQVVSVGPGKKITGDEVIPVSVKVGDKILFGKYAGTEIKVDGEKLLILREDDILAVVEVE